LGSKNMEYPHWIMIGGALLLVVGLVGTALQRRRAPADLSNLERGEATDGQPVSPPEFLKQGGSRAPVGSRGVDQTENRQ
jgi:hypothetical protein